MPQEKYEGREPVAMSGGGDGESIMKVFGATMALLGFAVATFNGLAHGYTFVSVIKQALVALVVGGAVGMLIALVVRYVVQEEFSRRHPVDVESVSAEPAESGSVTGPGQQGVAKPAGRSGDSRPGNGQVTQTSAGARSQSGH